MTSSHRTDYRARWRRLALLTAAFCLAACGYHFAGGGSLPGGVKSIFVPLVQNDTAETGLEGVVTNALLYEMNRRGIRVVADADAADAVLEGAIRGVVSETVTRRTAGTALERRARLVVSLRLLAADRPAPLWSHDAMDAAETYTVVSGDTGTTESNRRRALTEAAERLAEKALARMADNF